MSQAIQSGGEVLSPGTTAVAPITVNFTIRRTDGADALPQGDLLRKTLEDTEEYIKKSQADNTVSSYEYDWKDFESYCRSRRLQALPASPSTVMCYMVDMARGNWREKRKVSTILRRLAAINARHKREAMPLPASQKYPEISLPLQGIKRTEGMAQVGKRPMSVRLAMSMLHKSDTREPIAIARDKAILLLGLAGAFRRSELAAIDLENMEWHEEGITVHIKRSKTDGIGKGRDVEIPYGTDEKTCPVTAVENWLAAAGIDRNDNPKGPLLRPVRKGGHVVATYMNPYSIGYIIRKMAEKAGLNDKKKKKYLYSAHSLRAGFVTAAEAGGATERQIMRQTGHKSRQMIDRYSRREQEDRRAAAQKVGF